MTRYLVDLDGVVVDWTYQFNADLAERYPHLVFEELREFTTPKHLSQEHQDAINFVKNRPGFYRNMPPVPGAIEGLQTLVDYDAEVWFCSSPETFNESCESDKKNWLREYAGDAWAQRLILTRDKTLVRGDYLIDDRPYVKGVAEPEWEQILFSQPYNDDVTDQIRLNNWAELPSVIERLGN